MRKYFYKSILCFLALALTATSYSLFLHSQEEVAVTIEKVSGEVYCLYGSGGNIAILKGKDALLVVDAQYAGTAAAVMTEISKISPHKIKYLINTHYHGDHTNGNTVLGKNAQIISHKNCRTSYLAGLKPEDEAGRAGAPQMTYDQEMTVNFGEYEVKLFHFGPGHTSGDTVVVFEKDKVIHAGDLFFHGIPPYIDVKDGSDTWNWILTIEKLAEKYSDFTVIPGHGKVTNMKSFLMLADYLRFLREVVHAAIKEGKTREQAVNSIDLSKYDHIRNQGEFLTKKENIGWVYDEMTKK